MKGVPNILMVGVNWLGDACMTMPAIQRFRAEHPYAQITMLVKPGLASLWAMHPAINDVLVLAPGNKGLWRTATELRRHSFDVAYIFPNSWRSALVVFLAGIPGRIGAGGHPRHLLLTRHVRWSRRARTGHQQWEYADILELPPTETLPPPELMFPTTHPIPAAPADVITIGLMPGAARGPSKQWPESHFIEAARAIRAEVPACRFTLLGTPSEVDICNRVVNALVPDVDVSMAGKTSLPELAAALAACHGLLCNDSGGMHLAAAVGTPVTAVYGLTDPRKTGPLGSHHQCIRQDRVQGSRQIARHDVNAARILESISPETVAQAVIQQLRHTQPHLQTIQVATS